MAERIFHQTAWKAQTAFGTPATAPYQIIAESEWQPGISATRVADPTIRGNRFGTTGLAGTLPVAPRLSFVLRPTIYDVLILENLFQSTFATNVLTQGSTRKYATVEDRQPDVPMSILYQDLSVNTWRLTLAPNGLATCEATFLGTVTTPASTLSASPTAAPTLTTPFTGWNGTYNYRGGTLNVTQLTLEMNNNLESGYALGQQTPTRVLANADRVSGSMTLLLTDINSINDMINNTAQSLTFTMDTAGTTPSQVWALASIRITGWDSPVSGNVERLQTVQFEADAVGSPLTKVTVTRAP